MTKYKWDAKKGFVTGSGRPINPSYKVSLSTTGKTVVVYNKKGRVVGRVANAKQSPLGGIKTNSEGKQIGNTDEKAGVISFDGVTGNTWAEFQEEHIKVYGYEYH